MKLRKPDKRDKKTCCDFKQVGKVSERKIPAELSTRNTEEHIDASVFLYKCFVHACTIAEPADSNILAVAACKRPQFCSYRKTWINMTAGSAAGKNDCIYFFIQFATVYFSNAERTAGFLKRLAYSRALMPIWSFTLGSAPCSIRS